MLRVITASDTYDLTTLETVKQELNTTDNSLDGKFERLIREASADCARHCRRVFASEEVEETHRDVCGRDAFILERYPVASIDSIVVDGTALVAADWELDAESGMLYRLSGDSRCTWSGTKIVITYTAGYDLLEGDNPLPPDIERACIEQVKALHFSGSRDPMVKAVDVPGVISKQYWVGGLGDDDAVCPAAADRLTAYRKEVIG